MEVSKVFKFCPRCGSKFSPKKLFLKCSVCDLNFYITPKPTASVILYNGDGEYLLGKRAIEPRRSYWDTIGGFVDSNETLEQCAVREMKEELGINIKKQDLRYLESFLGNYTYQGIIYEVLNMVFLAKMPADARPSPADDVSEYAFFKAKDIPKDKLAFDWHKELLEVLNDYTVS